MVPSSFTSRLEGLEIRFEFRIIDNTLLQIIVYLSFEGQTAHL